VKGGAGRMSLRRGGGGLFHCQRNNGSLTKEDLVAWREYSQRVLNWGGLQKIWRVAVSTKKGHRGACSGRISFRVGSNGNVKTGNGKTRRSENGVPLSRQNWLVLPNRVTRLRRAANVRSGGTLKKNVSVRLKGKGQSCIIADERS